MEALIGMGAPNRQGGRLLEGQALNGHGIIKVMMTLFLRG